MDLSIIIPCHNLEKWIKPLLFSLKQQKLVNSVELIFVCDNCNDNTHTIIDDKMKNSQYKYFITDVDVKSCGLARNVGLAHATGKYIWFIDGDDWLIDNDAITKVIDWIQFTEAPYIKFDYDFDPSFSHYGYYSMVWQYLFLHEAIKDIKFPEIQPSEDRKFMDLIAQKYESSPPFLGEKLYYYNYNREDSNMKQFIEKGTIDQ